MNSWALGGFHETRELGTGGSGRVVMAVDQDSGTRVAIKYLDATLASDPGFLHGFRHEAELLRGVDSQHVARFYDYVESEHGAAIVMELVDGPSLRDVLRREGATTAEAALTVLKGSLLGLSVAHDRGVVHRDYKPENVLITQEGTSKLVDFGIAAREGATGATAGTPPYMAPEQWQGQRASPATDVYAATVTFFECVAGTRPFAGEQIAELAMKHVTGDVPVHLVPEPLRPLILRGMAKDFEDRPPSSAAFVEELEAVAVAHYGPDWEERGRRGLAALAGLLLPLLWLPEGVPEEASTEMAITDLGSAPGAMPSAWRARGPRAPVLAAGGALLGVAVLIGSMSGGAPSGHTASPPTSVAASDALDPASTSTSTASPSAPSPTTASASATPSESSASYSPTTAESVEALPSNLDPELPDAPQFPETLEPGTIGPPASSPASSPTPSADSVSVSSVDIVALDRAVSGRAATASIRVITTGTAPVSITLTWYTSDRSGIPGAQHGVTRTYIVSGRTTYSLSYPHDYSDDGCPWYWGVRASTTPQAASGSAYLDTDARSCILIRTDAKPSTDAVSRDHVDS
ncbi:serine/threonine-protein kinase [Streptomyces sp. Lzd4kr]|nr:serine/threonine-protein kinase [Streptomyces sp. Lzd4kr]